MLILELVKRGILWIIKLNHKQPQINPHKPQRDHNDITLQSGEWSGVGSFRDGECDNVQTQVDGAIVQQRCGVCSLREF